MTKYLFGFFLMGLLGFGLCVPNMSFASGSYSGRPPRPPSSDERALYTVGKNIFNGKTRLEVVTAPPEQQSALEELQQRLPKQAQTKANLADFSGKLTQGQFDALRHYLAVRYKVK